MIKIYRCENGHLYKFPQQSCFFCSHCTDIFYDYSHGPYMVFCELNNPNRENGNFDSKCLDYEDDLEDNDNIIRYEED